jgi:hypothetical protein
MSPQLATAAGGAARRGSEAFSAERVRGSAPVRVAAEPLGEDAEQGGCSPMCQGRVWVFVVGCRV